MIPTNDGSELSDTSAVSELLKPRASVATMVMLVVPPLASPSTVKLAQPLGKPSGFCEGQLGGIILHTDISEIGIDIGDTRDTERIGFPIRNPRRDSKGPISLCPAGHVW